MTTDALIDRFYAAIKANDDEALASCVHAEFELVWQGGHTIPWAGVWRGLAGLRAFFAVLAEHVEVVDIRPLHALSNNDVTIVVLAGHWRVGRNKIDVHAQAANVFAFERGAIRSYTVLNDTLAFASAMAGGDVN